MLPPAQPQNVTRLSIDMTVRCDRMNFQFWLRYPFLNNRCPRHLRSLLCVALSAASATASGDKQVRQKEGEEVWRISSPCYHDSCILLSSGVENLSRSDSHQSEDKCFVLPSGNAQALLREWVWASGGEGVGVQESICSVKSLWQWNANIEYFKLTTNTFMMMMLMDEWSTDETCKDTKV